MATQAELRDRWARAYGRQAAADLRSFELLWSDSDSSDSQALHAFQMAVEKVCKSFSCTSGIDPATLQSSHSVATHTLPLIGRGLFGRLVGRVPKRRYEPIIDLLKTTGREIDLLAPANDDGGRRPDNCEYPWAAADDIVRCPSDHQFGVAALLRTPKGFQLLKFIREAINDATRD